MVSPCRENGGLEGALCSLGEQDARAALASPCSSNGRESGRVTGDEFFLLDGSEFDHAVRFVGIAERGENFSCNAEVRMVHVLTQLGLWKSKGKATKIGGCARHGGPQEESIRVQQWKNTRVASGRGEAAILIVLSGSLARAKVLPSPRALAAPLRSG